MRYVVQCMLTGSYAVNMTVDADDPDDAMRIAAKNARDGFSSYYCEYQFVEVSDHPVEKPYSAAELAKIENDRLRRAGQREFWDLLQMDGAR